MEAHDHDELKERSITTGNMYVSMHPPARTSRSQTGTPGASRSQALAGGLRAAAAVHVVQRAVPSALVPASTAMPGPVGLSSVNLGVLAAQHMFAYMQTQIVGAAGGVCGASLTVLWRMRLEPLLSHKNPLDELRHASSVFPWICLLSRKVLAVPATSAAPERMFSSAGNKRANLKCDHLEELMYLHEVWLKVREWKAIKKARLK